MIQGIYSSVAGMANQWTMLEVITNNLANVSTVGYKRDDLEFSGTLNTLPTQQDYVTYSSRQVSLDNVTAKFFTDFSQGELQRTDNPFDLAIDGSGFFVIQYPDGIRYTRSGNFSLNSSGQLVTADGYPVLGINGPIQIQGNHVEFDTAGSVIADGAIVGTLRLIDFQDPSCLMKAGSNTYVIASNPNVSMAEMPSSAGIKQGFIENSNVNPIYEMAKMIETMRIYESYQKTIQMLNETQQKANEELGKITI